MLASERSGVDDVEGAVRYDGLSCIHSIHRCVRCADLPLCKHGCALAPGAYCVICDAEERRAIDCARGAFLGLASFGWAVAWGELVLEVRTLLLRRPHSMRDERHLYALLRAALGES